MNSHDKVVRFAADLVAPNGEPAVSCTKLLEDSRTGLSAWLSVLGHDLSSVGTPFGIAYRDVPVLPTACGEVAPWLVPLLSFPRCVDAEIETRHAFRVNHDKRAPRVCSADGGQRRFSNQRTDFFVIGSPLPYSQALPGRHFPAFNPADSASHSQAGGSVL